MRKCVILILPYLFFSLHIFSQDSLHSKNNTEYKNIYPASPLIVIKGDEIRRFPSTNFLDAVNGLFPWVLSETPDPNNFLFVLNGYLLPDINGLSLEDIDEIVFTRNNLNGDLYPLSRAGIFYIKTKITNNNKPEINFNSQYNTVWNKNAQVLPAVSLFPGYSMENHIMNKPGHFFRNQLSLAAGGKKLHLYTSLQLDAIQEPHLYQKRFIEPTGLYSDTTESNLKTRTTHLKAFLNLGYNFTDKLNAGISANYFNGQRKENSEWTDYLGYYSSYYITQSKTPLPYYYIGSFINWNLLHNLRNKFSFEYSDNSFNYTQTTELKSYLNGILNLQRTTITTTNPYNKNYLFRNQSEYDIFSKGRFRSGAATIFSYVHNKFFSESTTAQIQNGSLFSLSRSMRSEMGKTTILNPSIHFSYDNLFSGYAGYAFLLNKGISRYSKSSRSNPYAGFSVNLKNALKIKAANRLDLCFNYGDLTENNSNNYWLSSFNPDEFSTSSQVYGFSQLIFIPNPSLQFILLKNKLLGTQINSGFLNDRILAGAEWTSLELQRLFLVSVPLGGNMNGYTVVSGKEKETGFTIYMAGKLIDKREMHWDTRFNLLFPRVRYEINGVQPFETRPVNYILQAGIQNKFRFREFNIQANVSYGFDRKYYVPEFNQILVQKKFNEFILNYLLFSYDLSNSKNPVLRNLGIFIQGRNLLSSKKAKEYYRYNSYGGVGINLKIK
jgi:hypothetical protein